MSDQVILTRESWRKLTRLFIEIVDRADMGIAALDAFSDFTHAVAKDNPDLFDVTNTEPEPAPEEKP